MKLIYKFWLIISVLLLIAIALQLLDTYVSLKYEVEEPKAMGKLGQALNDKESYLKTTIFYLWVSVGYLSINLVLLAKSIFVNVRISDKSSLY
ncbi:MAG: hypothetical protein V4594_25020 [Bacteroidota bacterium]